MVDIFLSYASEDRERIVPLARILEGCGWSVFWDRKTPIGTVWDDYIAKNLKISRCVVVAWSNASVESRWVRSEGRYGLNREACVPLFLERVQPPFGFEQIQAADLSDWHGGAEHRELGDLVAHLRNLLDQPQMTTPSAERQGLLESLDAALDGRAPATPAETTTASQVAGTPTARSFDDDLTMVAEWYELDQDGRVAALSAHVAELTPEAFYAFRAHVPRMADKTAETIRQHEANEDNARGGSFEDRMSYKLARLKTGQRDPAFLARLRELQGYGTFYEWVAKASDLVWEERERRLRSPQDGDWLATIAMLRTQLQEGLASGEIRAERKASYERLIDKMETLMASLSDPSTSIGEKAKLLERFRGLMEEFQQTYVTPGTEDSDRFPFS